MSSPIVVWFTSEVYPWRTIAATSWAILSMPMMALTFVFLTGISLLHPFAWIVDTLGVLLTLRFFTSVLVLGVLQALLTRFSITHFSVLADIEKTRLNSALGLFRWSRLPFLVLCIFAGAVSTWSLLFLAGPDLSSLTEAVVIYSGTSNELKRFVLKERHLFLVESGMFFGLCHFVSFFWLKQNYLSFPHIQRHKFFHISREVSNLLHSSYLVSIRNTIYFFIIYFLFGGVPKIWIINSFGMEGDSRKSSLTSLWGLLDMSLFWQTYSLCLVLTFTWTFSCTLLRVFHTQHLEFDIQNVIEVKQNKGLAEAMASPLVQLLQHLAFYDFCSLSRHSKPRRQELFSLSQPGGHPRVWMAVSRAALHVIRELTLKIQETNRLIMSRVAVAGQTQRTFEDISRSSFLYSTNPDQADTSVHGDCPNKVLETQASQPISKIKATLSNIPFITQLIAENPDTNSRHLFASCQVHIWAVDGLSQVACCSYTEDKYGVVQGFLPSLIYALIDLHEAIEKHFKCTSVVRRPGTSEDSSDASLPPRLHSVTITAIYRIVNTYKQHLDDLHLSPDYMKKIQMFNEVLV